MNNFLQSYLSIAPAWAAAALQKFMGRPSDTTTVVPITPAPIEVFDYRTYNQSMLHLYQQLHLSYARLQELESQDQKSTRKTQADLDAIDSAVGSLESSISFILDSLPIRDVYTDTLYETFGPQAKVESGPNFYQGGLLPRAYVNPKDKALTLAALSETIFSRSYLPNSSPICTLDRVLGMSMAEGTTLDGALDGNPYTYWKEEILAKLPIYANLESKTWLPDTYAGGAACRLRVDLFGESSVSEITIEPLGEFPSDLLGIGYTVPTPMIIDPNFTSVSAPAQAGSAWTSGAISYGTEDSGTVTISDGVACLATTSSTGNVWIQSLSQSVGPVYCLDVSFDAKAQGHTPFEVTIFAYNQLLEPIGESTQSLFNEGDGWTSISMSFDVPVGAVYYTVRFTNPPNFERPANLWIAKPQIRRVLILPQSKRMEDTSTITLPYPVDTYTIFLVMGQQHADLKGIAPIQAEHMGARLMRRSTKPYQLMSWEFARDRGVKIPNLQPQSLEQAPKVLSELSPSVVDGLTTPIQQGGGELFYTYTLGAHNIHIKRSEYAQQGRYVSPPLKVAGEIREIRLSANDEYLDREDITYTITQTETDPPEAGKAIQNSTRPSRVTTATAPAIIQYLGDWTGRTSNFTKSSVPAGYNNSDAYVQKYLEKMVWFSTDVSIGVNSDQVGLLLDSTLDLSNSEGVVLECFLATPTSSNAVGGLRGSFLIQLINDDYQQNPVALEGTFDAFAHPLQYGQVQFGFTSVALEPTGGPGSRSTINRWAIIYTGGTLSSSPAYLIVRNARSAGSSSTSRVVRFLPADESEALSAGAGDFVIPPKSKVEMVKGTDRNGRAFLKSYPYVNMERVRSISESMALGTSGRQVAFDPNILQVRALTAGGVETTVVGYRPLTVSLYFPDGNLRVIPDSLGRPKPGDLGYSEEILEISTLSTKTISRTQEVTDQGQEWFQTLLDKNRWGKAPTSQNPTSWGSKAAKELLAKTTTKTVTNDTTALYYQTASRPIVTSMYGTPISIWWRKSSDNTLQAIASVNLQIDAEKGLVNILEPAPEGFDQVKCAYYYVRSEASLREYYTFDGILGTTTTTQGLTQSYPITRNMTDYMRGITPILKPPILDSGSPEYYPVFEYYVHPAGYLVFALNMHTYSDTPADITVEYETIDVSPRIIVDLKNTQYDFNPSRTPKVFDYTLLLNVRR